MPYPSEPNKIILKNKIYAKGLKSLDIYNYYINNKTNILNNCKDHKVLFFLSFNYDQPLIVKRNHNSNPIYLNNENYDDFISGHVISISKEINNKSKTNNIVLDLDPVDISINENDLKKYTNSILQFMLKSNDVYDHKIVASAKGYHLYFNTKKFYNIQELVDITTSMLDKEFSDEFYINQKSKKEKNKPINIDLSPMYNRGSLTVPYALTRVGTICMPIINLKSFNRSSTILK